MYSISFINHIPENEQVNLSDLISLMNRVEYIKRCSDSHSLLKHPFFILSKNMQRGDYSYSTIDFLCYTPNWFLRFSSLCYLYTKVFSLHYANCMSRWSAVLVFEINKVAVMKYTHFSWIIILVVGYILSSKLWMFPFPS